MTPKVNILEYESKKNCIAISPSLLPDKKHRKKAYLRFGIKAVEVDVITSAEISNSNILISKNIINELCLPLLQKYELKSDGVEIILGPYIGILACKEQQTLDSIVNNLSNYLYDYEDLGGAFVAFSSEGIDITNEVINGYMFNPVTLKWDAGVYTYPSCIFRRSGLSNIQRNHLHSKIGDKIFNNFIFDKWEMHEWLEKSPKIKNFLPETIKYKHPSDITWFLDHFQTAYIKPISGSQGFGISRTYLDEGNYIIKLNDKENNENAVQIFTDKKEFHNFLKSKLKANRYLIQQSIDVLTLEDKMIDFRVLLVKDYYGQWKDMGIIAKYGVKGNIVSNISSGGYASTGEDAFRNVCGLNDDEIFTLRNRISDLCILAAQTMEDYGIHCANFGIDIAIDNNLNIWIIEINNKDPNHTIAIDAGAKQIFYQTKKMNMLYAKRLAGF
ncbi:MAG: hypothetical protein K0S34_596 [Bacillales bacterium]|jgi:hypothetical protein|nr:hypothetical protein [Bacillales bacterium]